jgi:hypothetical protein
VLAWWTRSTFLLWLAAQALMAAPADVLGLAVASVR